MSEVSRRPLELGLAGVRRILEGFGHEAGLVLAARMLQNFNGFLLSVLVVRRFGLSGAGTLAVATVATVVLALVAAFGLTYTLARLTIPMAQRNQLGAIVSAAILPLSLPLVIALGLAAGQTGTEAAVIALMSTAGVFFAQTNIVFSLQVLQGRTADSIIPATGNLAGLIAAGLFGADFLTFAILLALFRFASIAIAFQRLPRAGIALADIRVHLREGLRYITADALLQGGDQATVLLTSYLISREELGLFGLCRQLLTVSDTPGWSQVQTSYPALVADPRATMPALRRRMLIIGVVCAAAVIAVTIPLSLYVYHQPRLLMVGPFLLASVPVRYLLMTYDIRLRALAMVARTNWLALARAVLAVAIIPAAAWRGGAFGAVVGTVLVVGLATLLTGLLPGTPGERGEA